MENIKNLGWKGIAFLVLSILIVICGILTCVDGEAFPIVVGLLGIILGALGIFASIKRHLLGLLIFFYGALIIVVLAITLLFILLLVLRSYSIPSYVGTIGLIFFGGGAAWLAFDGRGRTLSPSPTTS